MDTLFESLATLKDRPIGTVLHIGAGNGLVLARYADLAPERVVLVEGDTDTAAQLQRRAAGLRWAEVRAQAVAATQALHGTTWFYGVASTTYYPTSGDATDWAYGVAGALATA